MPATTGNSVSDGPRVEPGGLIVDAACFGERRDDAARQVEDGKPPSSSGVAAECRLERDPFSVRGKGRALDAVADGTDRARRDVALHEVSVAPGRHGREEPVVVLGEGDAPEVQIGGPVRPSVDRHAEVLKRPLESFARGGQTSGACGEPPTVVRIPGDEDGPRDAAAAR